MLEPTFNLRSFGVDSGSNSDLLAAKSPAVLVYNGGIGDRICFVPSLRALSKIYGGRLSLICGKGDRKRYYSDISLRNTYEIELIRVRDGWQFDVEALAGQLSGCDALLCVCQWITDSISELVSRFPRDVTVGFFPTFGRHVDCNRSAHIIDMAFAIPLSIDPTLNVNDYARAPAIDDAAADLGREFQIGFSGSKRTLFVHMHSARERSWPRDRFSKVIDEFLDAYPEYFAVVVDVWRDGFTSTRFPDRVTPISLPIESCWEVLCRSNIFLGIDSCHLHMADLLRIPSAGLFGPSSSQRWGLRFAPHRHVEGHGTMEAITVEAVNDALLAIAKMAED